MSTTQLRRQIKKKVNSLPPEKLQSAADYLSYLAERSNGKMTFEEKMLARPPIMERIKQAEKDIAAGRVYPVEQLRRKYGHV